MTSSPKYWFIYMDESGDEGLETRRSHWFCETSLALPMDEWHASAQAILAFRRKLKNSLGVRIRDELHARDLDGERGAFSSARLGRRLEDAERFDLIAGFLRFVNSELPVRIVNCYADKKAFKNKRWSLGLRDVVLDRMLNRYNVMWHKQGTENRAVVIHDDGAEPSVRLVVRRLREYNWIASQKKRLSQNIPLKYILEDPLFVPSRHNWFLQVCDIVCYALRGQYQSFGKLHSFPQKDLLGELDNVLMKEASSHPLGVIEIP